MQLKMTQKFRKMNLRRKKKFIKIMFYRAIIDAIGGTESELKKLRRGSKKNYQSIGVIDIGTDCISFKGAF